MSKSVFESMSMIQSVSADISLYLVQTWFCVDMGSNPIFAVIVTDLPWSWLIPPTTYCNTFYFQLNMKTVFIEKAARLMKDHDCRNFFVKSAKKFSEHNAITSSESSILLPRNRKNQVCSKITLCDFAEINTIIQYNTIQYFSQSLWRQWPCLIQIKICS